MPVMGSLLRHLFLLIIAVTTAVFTTQAMAQVGTKDVVEQQGRESPLLVPITRTFNAPEKEKPFRFNDFMKNLHGSYYVSLMGPRLLGASNETYNIFLADVAPIQLFHAWSLGYQVNNNLQIGVSTSAVQALANNVVGNTGYIYNESFEIYDPNIYFNFPNLIQISGWNVFTTFSFSLPVTEASQNIGKVTSLILSQNWNIAEAPDRWTIGFTLFAEPKFYTDPMPPGFIDRQTLVLAVGHYLAYQVSPAFSLKSTSTIDFEHRSPSPNGFVGLGENLSDRMRFAASITPQTFPLLISIGGYMQFLMWEPSYETSIIGADFSIGF